MSDGSMSDKGGPASSVDFTAVEAALATVQRTLDGLTARGKNEAAFELARAQYAASIRSSWPGNLSSLAGALSKILGDDTLGLSAAEKDEIAKAVAVFGRIQHP